MYYRILNQNGTKVLRLYQGFNRRTQDSLNTGSAVVRRGLRGSPEEAWGVQQIVRLRSDKKSPVTMRVNRGLRLIAIVGQRLEFVIRLIISISYFRCILVNRRRWSAVRLLDG